jgi:endonuclease/exonuclease/phosphatase family metal-dependent hydrolase
MPRLALTLVLALFLLSTTAACRAQAPVAGDLDACIRRLAKTAASTSEPLPATLVVSSWNSKKFSRDGATQTLVSLAADSALLLLQESLRDGAAASAHGSRLFAAGFGRRAWQSGVEIRSTVAPIARCALTFREPWLRTPKAVAVATYALPDGDTLLVVNLHAINFTMTFGRGSYRAQFTALGRLLDAHRGPAIVGGDFNDWNPWRGGTLQRFAGRHGLQVVAIRPDWRSRHPLRPVDAIYLRGLRALDGTAIPTATSDHHPLRVLVSLSP